MSTTTDATPLHRNVGVIAFAYGAAHLVFIVAPPFLSEPFGASGLRTGDILDFATPLVLIPLGWLLFRVAAPQPPSALGIGVFMLLAVVWVQGQAMHLAANAISHLVVEPGELQHLVDYLDEELSHQLWHGAVIGLAALTMRRAWTVPPQAMAGRTLAAVLIGAVLFGATFFSMVVEGVTWPFALPAALILLVVGLVATGGRPVSRPVIAFYVVAFSVALGLSATWAALNDWELVEFSKVFGF
ncbi:MAG TPA: hypothetical protein VF071_09660 [Candidatus Limnocylindria bacterium]